MGGIIIDHSCMLTATLIGSMSRLKSESVNVSRAEVNSMLNITVFLFDDFLLKNVDFPTNALGEHW